MHRGGYSLANTTVIEAKDGLIVYDTGDTKEEAEHIRDAIKKISDKPVKVIIYSHSHYAMGGGALLDNPKDEAARMVLLMGGKDKVVSAAKSALDKKEFFWGAQVIQYVYLLEPENKEVRNLKAELLRQMAYRTTGSIARAFLMTEALALEGKVTYPKLIPPGSEIIAGSPETFVNFFRVRIDPKKSENTDKVVEFVFTDKGNHAVALHVRRGIAEYIPVPADYFRESDFVLNVDSETWVGLYLSEMSLKDAIDSGKVNAAGNKDQIAQIFDMFDKFRPAKNYMVPPLED